MKRPFKQRKSGSKLIREFSSDVAEKELVWHRDHLDRYVKIQEGVGWKLQLENKLPIELEPGLTYYIPKKTYHRVIKGTGALVVEIKEIGQKMKITKNQLREIIAEERKKLDEQGFHSMSPAGKALANSIKGKFMRMYPDAKVGIDGRGGFITVNGKKAIDMSQATGRGMSDDEMIEKMHTVYAETQIDDDIPTADSRMSTFREGKNRVTKRQLRQIVKEEVSRLMSEKYQPQYGHPGGPLRDDEFRDAFEHRGVKVPFDIEAAGLNADKLYEMGFKYEQHSPGVHALLRHHGGPYKYTLGFWFDPKDDWREAKLRAAGRL